MTQKPHARPRAALFIGAALLATPAFAQDAPTQTVTPPPVVSTVPQTPAPAPATVTFAPAAPTVQAVPEVPTAQTPPRAATRTRAARRTTTTTTATRQATRTTAPAAAAPAPAPEPAAPVAAPVEQPAPTAVTPPEAAPIAPAQTETVTAATTETAPAPRALWPWLLGGALIVVGVIAALLFRRRTEYDEVYEEPYEPTVVAEPVPIAEERTFAPRHEPEVAPFVAPVAEVRADEKGEPLVIAEDAEIVKAEAADVADLTAAAPHSHRPWLEFGMRPVRAGTSSDEALVDIELTVANSGDMAANNVRISTFLLKDGEAGDMERLLTEHDSSVPPVTIAAGEGTRVDATLAVRRDELQSQGDNFSPMVVADARYTMADGTEGRTSATFRVGLWDGDNIEPIEIGRPQMHDNVAAELHGTPEHA